MFGGRQPSAVVFDLNDTLVHGGDRALRDAVAHAMARDLEVDPEAFAAAVRDSFDARCRGVLGDLHQTITRLAAGLGASPDPAAVRAAAERRLHLERSLLIPAPRALEALDRLRRRGLRLGLVSDCSAETPQLWCATRLAHRFDVAVFSCELGARKPDPSLYLAATAGLGVLPEECLYVGDGASDELAGAERVGMTALRLRLEDADPAALADRREFYGLRSWDGPSIGHVAELDALLDTAAAAAPRDQDPTPLPQRTVTTGVAGHSTQYTDPLWRLPTRLTPLEQALSRTRALRRLHFIAHGGAAALTTTQTYSRLEHSLGVFTLTAHFHPDDQPLRAAALLHDIGHLPFSHTFEGVAGLNHHALGISLLHEPELSDVLASHGLEPHHVADLLTGRTPSPLSAPAGLLSLDHLDSYVRSARFGARLDVEPGAVLSAVELVNGAVSTDPATARTLAELVCAEARLHVSWENVAPSAALQRLVRSLLDTGRHEPIALARMTDAQLWAALDSAPGTQEEADSLRISPHRLRTRAAQSPSPSPATPPAWNFALRKIYTSAPLINGLTLEAAAPDLAAQLAALRDLPTEYHVWWDAEQRQAPSPSGRAPVKSTLS